MNAGATGSRDSFLSDEPSRRPKDLIDSLKLPVEAAER